MFKVYLTVFINLPIFISICGTKCMKHDHFTPVFGRTMGIMDLNCILVGCISIAC